MKKLKILILILVNLALLAGIVLLGFQVKANLAAQALEKQKAKIIAQADDKLGVAYGDYGRAEVVEGPSSAYLFYPSLDGLPIAPIKNQMESLATAMRMSESDKAQLIFITAEQAATALKGVNRVQLIGLSYLQKDDRSFHTAEEIKSQPFLLKQDQTFLTLDQLFKDSSQARQNIIAKVEADSQFDATTKQDLVTFFQNQDLAHLRFSYESAQLTIELPQALGELTSLSLPLTNLFDVINTQYLQGEDLKAYQAYEAELARKKAEAAIKSGQKLVALTFDDGPKASTTPQVLDLLAKYRAKATFFVVGSSIAGNEAILQRMVKEGHQIGSHTWSHPKLTHLDANTIRQEMALTQDAIQSAIGQKTTIFRAPYGALNQAVMNTVNLPAIQWSVDTLDWRTRNTEGIMKEIRAHTDSGAIILMHDIHSTTVAALPSVLDYLTKNGYTLVTVNDLLGASLQPNLVYYNQTTWKPAQ